MKFKTCSFSFLRTSHVEPLRQGRHIQLGRLAEHALHVQCPKLGFSLVGLPGETKRPFNPRGVLLGPFYIVLSQLTMKIYLVKFSGGKNRLHWKMQLSSGKPHLPR